jgi:hypothetical protein
LSKESSPFHDRMRSYASRRIQASQQFMAQRYDRWREAERLYRSFRDPDQGDLEVSAQGITLGVKKIVVPFTYALIQSIVAWMVQFFTDRKPIFPVEGLGPDDEYPAILHEHLLEYQMDNMDTPGVLVMMQLFLDAQIYGLGVGFNAWMMREFLDYVRQVQPLGFEGQLIGHDDTLIEQDTVAYEGNNAINVLPYDWFPDPRMPIGRFQSGEFCGYRTRRVWQDLLVKRAEGLYEGIQYIPETRTDSGSGSGRGASDSWGAYNETELGKTLGVDSEGWHYIDEHGKPPVTLHHLYAMIPPDVLQLDSVPKTSDLPRMWVIRLANMGRVIGVEPANQPGRKFPFFAIEGNFNLHSPLNPGLVEIMSGPQNHLSWLVNSRTANVRRSLNFELIYDPSMIESADLEESNASGLIRLKQSAYHGGVPLNQIVQPLPVSDVTQGHMVDARSWMDLMEQISGANRMIQGLSNTGRRAATEVQASLSLAAGRLKLGALIASQQGLQDWVLQMIANNRTFLSQRLTVRARDPYSSVLNQDFLEVTPQQLQGMFRVPLMEQGIPTDKQFHAATLKELLQMLITSSPESAAALGSQINASSIFIDLLRLLGKKNLKAYFQPTDPRQQAMQQMMAQQQTETMPDEQVQQQVQAGNLIPNETPGGFGRPAQESTPGTGAGSAFYQ